MIWPWDILCFLNSPPPFPPLNLGGRRRFLSLFSRSKTRRRRQIWALCQGSKRTHLVLPPLLFCPPFPFFFLFFSPPPFFFSFPRSTEITRRRNNRADGPFPLFSLPPPFSLPTRRAGPEQLPFLPPSPPLFPLSPPEPGGRVGPTEKGGRHSPHSINLFPFFLQRFFPRGKTTQHHLATGRPIPSFPPSFPLREEAARHRPLPPPFFFPPHRDFRISRCRRATRG